MSSLAEPVAKLVRELSKLPGIGPKSAQRLTYYLLRSPDEEAKTLAEAILALKEKISLCSICFNITDCDPCPICQDKKRDYSIICVVEKPSDIMPLERTGKYNGVYHVLHGTINPAEGRGPEELKIKELLSRLQNGAVKEVILATNPNIEGETTALYLQRLIVPLGIRVSRLARGLPFGAELEYADDMTLSQALEGRQVFQ
ncbi:MAG: recombination protein RecR [Chloroflexi bacterium CG_4_9_14_3_um_filter_45_9]|nr:MAG: recombination protein RecR [Dehalococcoidia bacterium CG2_30_46_9]PIU23386.1 MAG: recombination protein RecR [Chloroflexi bacterium CG08_land_8_20_14_0_20_45_12]PIX27794.1 MAG: recombination protein RecR [Chloroflexi bacterium CG_4_8_14_3_um_filter_45_15]PJB51010.1 MAG: recombination protein RecR [Chloroflexi bacterium CG_4_9_14_3_um_filter_45_9]